MKKKPAATRDAAELRRRAEARLSKSKKRKATLPATKAETMRLVHELQVQQIELEMRNEELLQTYAEIEARLSKYTDLYDSVPVGYFTLARDGAIRYANLAGARLLGVERAQLMKRRFGLFVSAEARLAFNAFLVKVFESKRKEVCEVVLLKDGHEPLWVKVEVIAYEDGQECRAVVVDITERKQAEAELIEREMLNFALFEYNPIQTVVVDFEGKVIKFNLAKRKSGDRLPNIGDTMYKDYAGKHEIDMYAELMKCIRSGEEKKFPEQKYGDGVLSITISPFPKGAVIISEDITERNRAEEEVRQKAKDLQEKNDELIRFTAAVLHDLRSPLITIQTFQGYLGQDIRSQDAARIEKDLGYIRNAADRISHLIDELLRLSRDGQIINPSEDAPLQAIVQDALNLVAGRITARGVRVDITEEPVVLWGDRTRLMEVFQNLVDNAAKFMGDEPAPRVEIGVEQADEEMVLYVRDNGIGIDPQVQPTLFGLFQKLNPETEGMGIGLALVRRIVELHGGRIWVESEGPGKGATFRFTLAKTRRKRVEETLPEPPEGAG